jgi:DNA-binding NarL/FixJ family response regulator
MAEIMLAAGELDRARVATDELAAIAADFGTEILGAVAAHARGALQLAEGDAESAVEPLRHAFGVWHRVGAPYIAARIRTLLARAYRGLGDRDGAGLELEAARHVFASLGAEPDLERLASVTAAAGAPAHGLSRRELEVLRLVARGKTNRAIAAELCLSQRTIDRHVSNIFSKIDVASRAAATAFAYQNDLV